MSSKSTEKNDRRCTFSTKDDGKADSDFAATDHAGSDEEEECEDSIKSKYRSVKLRRRGLHEKKKGRQVSGGGSHALIVDLLLFFSKKIRHPKRHFVFRGGQILYENLPQMLETGNTGQKNRQVKIIGKSESTYF